MKVDTTQLRSIWKLLQGSHGTRRALALSTMTVVRKPRRAWEIFVNSPKIRESNFGLVTHVLDWQKTAQALIDQPLEATANSPERIDHVISQSRLTLVPAGQAVVTIIVPSYEREEELLACLESILCWPPETPTHLLIADDASTTFDPSQWAPSPGITVLRNPSNLGYIRNVNQAATHVSSQFLMTLNQDTIVLPGCIDGLVHELEIDTQVEVIGPLIIGTDWVVNECGGSVITGAHAAHRGRGAQLGDPDWAYAADVDYVSGCALLVRTATWVEMGGLWDALHPAYYDDTDFCLRIWSSGGRVRVLPTSGVIHREGTVMGRDPNDKESLKRFQLINREHVAHRHKEILRDRESRPTAPTVVFISWEAPHPELDGGSIDFDLFLRYTIESHVDTRLVMLKGADLDATAQYRTLGIGCASIQDSIAGEWLEQCDLIITLGLLPGITWIQRNKQHTTPWVHWTGDVATRRLETSLSAGGSSLAWYRELPKDPSDMWNLEQPLLERPNETLYVSEPDLRFVEEHGAQVDNAAIFPILRAGPIPPSDSFPQRHPNVAFVGSMAHGPNPDAVEWLINDIWPLVVAEIPSARLTIWGSHISHAARVSWSSHLGVTVHGKFMSWEEISATTRVVVAPLRFGAGIKGKVVSAIQHGVPVIGTPIAFDGISPEDGPTTFSDDPHVLAEQLIDVLRNEESWTSLLQANARLVGESFSPAAERDRVRKMLQRHGIATGKTTSSLDEPPPSRANVFAAVPPLM